MEAMSLDANMSHISRVRRWLLSKGAQEVQFSISDVAHGIGSVLEDGQIRSSLKYLEKRGEVEIIRDTTTGGRQFIRGARLIKMESTTQIIEESAERTKDRMTVATDIEIDNSKVPTIRRYVEQKLAVSRAASILSDAGLPTDGVNLERNPIAEEAIYLLELISSLNMQLKSISVQRDNAEIAMQEWMQKADYYRSKIYDLPLTQREKIENDAPWNRP